MSCQVSNGLLMYLIAQDMYPERKINGDIYPHFHFSVQDTYPERSTKRYEGNA